MGMILELIQQDKNIKIYMFDMDIDGKPELCLSDVQNTYFLNIYLIADNIYYGGELVEEVFRIMGSRKVSQFSSKGKLYFTQLDKLGMRYVLYLGPIIYLVVLKYI